MKTEMELAPEERLNRLIIERATKILEEAGISSITHKEEGERVRFFIKPPPEHIEERKKQMARLGSLGATDFTRKLVAFEVRFRQEYGEYLSCEHSLNGNSYEYTISPKHINLKI